MHINVYGPAASGKTRNAEMLKEKYGCVDVIDATPVIFDLMAPERGRTLILTQEPLETPGVTCVPIEEALK